jgi:hypothetical protein
MGRITVAAVAIAMLAACPADHLECFDVDPTCQPLYAPTWDNVFANTLHPKCGTGGGACHEGTSARGGLRLDDHDLAYSSLTAPGKDYVMVDDVPCSQVIERIYASSADLRMPRGSSLPDAERCAIAQWILAGAPGPVDAGVDASSAEVDAP